MVARLKLEGVNGGAPPMFKDSSHAWRVCFCYLIQQQAATSPEIISSTCHIVQDAQPSVSAAPFYAYEKQYLIVPQSHHFLLVLSCKKKTLVAVKKRTRFILILWGHASCSLPLT